MAGRDLAIRSRMKPEAPTQRELDAMAGISDVDFTIFRHKMHTIAQEAKQTCSKLGASAGVRWGDLAMCIYTNSGDSAAVATGIWFHAVLGQIPLKYIIKHWANDESVGIRDGDIFYCNDPLYGGVHTPDMAQYSPVFYRGELVCWVGVVSHSNDTGATEPGGVPMTAKSRYDEGMHIPPTKIGEGGRLREDVLNMMAHMVRDPRGVILDIKARAAACNVAKRRILEVIERQGVDIVVGGLRRLISSTAAAARQRVAQLNDGIYRQPRFLDSVGTEDALMRIMVTLRKQGDKVHVDLTGSSPEIPDKPMNSHALGIMGVSFIYLCGYLFWDLPANSGLLEAFQWNFPDNSLVNPSPEAPTALSPMTQVISESGVAQAGAKMLYNLDPKRAVAPWFRGFNMAYMGGMNQYGEPIADIAIEMNGGGLGARPDMDGEHVAGAFFATMSDVGDVETTETERPIFYLFRRFFQDSHGFGKYRGGAGLDYALMVKHVPWFFMGCMGFGSKTPSTLGLFGGYAIPTFTVTKIKQSNLGQLMGQTDPGVPFSTHEALEKRAVQGVIEHGPISMPGEVMLNGDVMLATVGGGSGYGDVLERDPEAVMADVRDGITSTWAAQSVYGVVFDPVTLHPDLEATAKVRSEERARRLEESQTYEEFERAWNQMRPPDYVVRYYGPYPDPAAPAPRPELAEAGD